ncbi:MAG: hypothetical protein LBV04_08735, partial [Deferribacteraceae bacterium]|nr:hypothetical protein [Deferribacteraceae bacterium]
SKADFKTNPYQISSTEWADGKFYGESSLDLVWQVGIGARYQLNEQHSLDFTVRYIDLGKPEYELTDSSGGVYGGNMIAGGSYDLAPVDVSAIKFDLGYKFWF